MATPISLQDITTRSQEHIVQFIKPGFVVTEIKDSIPLMNDWYYPDSANGQRLAPTLTPAPESMQVLNRDISVPTVKFDLG